MSTKMVLMAITIKIMNTIMTTSKALKLNHVASAVGRASAMEESMENCIA